MEEPLLPPIPTSREVRDRDFRSRILPMVVFGSVVFIMVIIWWFFVSAPMLVGQVEPITTFLNSPKTGVVADLKLVRLQNVKAGEEVARIVTTDPQVVESSLDVLRAEIALLKLNLAPEVTGEKYAIQYDRLRLDSMEQHVELADSQVKLDQADRDLQRAQSLSAGKILAQSAYEQTKAIRDKLAADVQERGKLVAAMDKSVEDHRLQTGSSITEVPASPGDVLQASIAVQEEKVRLTEAQLEPIILRAPVDGVISMINRHNGETVAAGDPIATITALHSDHIIGYIRQPMTVHVAAGMKVDVQARSFNRAVGRGTVISVGSQLETINPLLLTSPVPVLGLPVNISVPAGMHLVPGEVVDLALR